jgi:hypothetical protein
MVNKVEAPQPRHAVDDPMPQVQGVVHQHDGDHVAERARQAQSSHEAPPAFVGASRQRHHHRHFHQMHDSRRQAGNNEIARRMLKRGLNALPQGAASLEPDDHRSDSDEE